MKTVQEEGVPHTVRDDLPKSEPTSSTTTLELAGGHGRPNWGRPEGGFDKPSSYVRRNVLNELIGVAKTFAEHK